MSEALELSTECSGLVLCELMSERDDLAYFESVLTSRVHLINGYEPETVEKYQTLESVREARLNPADQSKLRFGIWHDEKFAGSINLVPAGHAAEIGYWLDVRHTGKGYATFATRALANHALKEYAKIIATVKEGNVKSVGVLERSGFRYISKFASANGERMLYTFG